MAIDLVFDNYARLRAAWTAMDQGYGMVQIGDSLHAIDNSGGFGTQPFSTPTGYIVANVIQDSVTGLQMVVYINSGSGDILINSMGTNGWVADQWQNNITGDMGETAWNNVNIEVMATIESLLSEGANAITWAGDSRGVSIAQYGMMAMVDAQSDPLYSNISNFNFENMGAALRNGPGVEWALTQEK